MKKFQKIVCLWMAILLTALSANATILNDFGVEHTDSNSKDKIDSILSGKGIPYFIDSSQQELVAENEQESLPLTPDGYRHIHSLSNYNGLPFFFFLKNSQKISPENTAHSTYYTKQILFPFHSYW